MIAERRRRPLVVGAALLVVAGVSTAAALVPNRPSAPTRVPASAVLAGAGAASSAWYCAGVADAPLGTQAALLVVNANPRPVSGTIDTVPVGSQVAAPQSFSVPADKQVVLPVVTGATTVLVHGGAVAVEQVLSGPLGPSAAPCASSTSTSWYFAQGSTASGFAVQVALYNPLPTPAVVNVTFVSATGGAVEPPAYQGVPVGAGTVVVENVGDHVQNDPSVATEVSALSGSVVAAEIVQTAGPGGNGLSLVDGVSTPSPRWAFAANADLSGGGTWFSIFNPSHQTCTVTVSFALAQGEAAPLVVRVLGQSLLSVAAQDLTRIPTGTLFGLVFSASSGRGIVVARTAASPAGVVPSIGVTQGQPDGVHRWLVPAVVPGELPWGLALLDMASRPVHVELHGFASGGRLVLLPGQSAFTLQPGILKVIPSPGTPVGWSPSEVTADGPVAVQLDPVPAAPPGTATVPAWPLLS